MSYSAREKFYNNMQGFMVERLGGGGGGEPPATGGKGPPAGLSATGGEGGLPKW
jgi:hypothetical protein